ncbi:MAG: FAD-dependent oxidoreductase [Candidatus Omnitrophota bacterium]
MKPQIVILGAGVTGLAAAWKLLKSSDRYDITLVERDAVPGGMAKTLSWNGLSLDLGPHRFHTEIPEIQEFMRGFCLKRLVRVKRFSRMFLNGCYIPYPISPWPTLRALGMRSAAALALSALSVLFRQPARPAETYEEYVKGYYGDGLYLRIFEPFAIKVWGLHPSRIAAETARVRLRGDNIWRSLIDGFLSKQETYVAEFLYPPGGIGEIARKFAEEVEAAGGKFLYQREAVSLRVHEGRIESVELKGSGGSDCLPCDVLINTIPLPDMIRLLTPSVPAEIAGASDELHFRGVVLLYLLYKNDLVLSDTWLYYPEMAVPFTRISVPGNFDSEPSRRAKNCLCLEFCCEAGDQTWNSDHADLADKANAVLASSGLVQSKPIDSLALHLREGYPVYHAGYEKPLRRVLAHLRAMGNVLTAGRQGLFRHNNIDQSIQMGLLAAEEIMAQASDFSHWYDSVSRFNDYRIVD